MITTLVSSTIANSITAIAVGILDGGVIVGTYCDYKLNYYWRTYKGIKLKVTFTINWIKGGLNILKFCDLK